ncbi:FMN-binding protein [Phycicoccus sp. Soil748]|uniref:FMN-binding protein n=1 Tax=Phycicoccus sp. Soil748 TaxID=1736397 RepID=UPI000702C64C|nr:FMN-binding protein [Phycicoccus sp. Soil748]KRE55261.1 FMN-binding protein [Phycicoccus sp. Soil748]
MRRITLWALSTLTTLVLLFSYHTSTSSRSAAATAPPVLAQAAAPSASSTPEATTPSGSPTTSGSSGSSGSGSTGSGSGSGSSSSTPSSSSSSSSSSSASAAKTYDGNAVSTRFGNVQVQITVAGGKITAAQVLQVPWNDHRDQEINSYAVPVLNSEVVQAQSATIDMVSGATYTSDGYIQSLQSAIDQAHL